MSMHDSQIMQDNGIGGNEYNKYKDEVSLQKYCVALDELERLMVMQLFELSKLSLSEMGYKLWQQIRKALQRRSDAIQNAINKYNVQATALNPSRPCLSWKDIADYSFLGEFDPTHREGSVKFFKLRHAYEEVEHLNIEVHHLQTAIHDEGAQISTTINKILDSNPLLGWELQKHWKLHSAVFKVMDNGLAPW
ncbi:uncharacterized protein BJ212DRAFT_1445004 [Suillus subaureus]|uniref:Uncharacterized protein n=1 Tax=Suillus subaureus TaxID=48587 RepID=A0A9P7EJC6_9AGAM|nr:uncharacterized protein BJ212DRAFT_1445004 [Suillus subaureus]KAG1822782.1 hypothetical protein BJ212DRAFT_1445004 [Suillus subaureus]